jgi:prepilin signal peptidase PulO-like enzyme (type II secretory pathway)
METAARRPFVLHCTRPFHKNFPMTLYFLLAACWFTFVCWHQRQRYDRKHPHFMDTFVEHFVLFPVGVALYAWTGLLEVKVDRG